MPQRPPAAASTGATSTGATSTGATSTGATRAATARATGTGTAERPRSGAVKVRASSEDMATAWQRPDRARTAAPEAQPPGRVRRTLAGARDGVVRNPRTAAAVSKATAAGSNVTLRLQTRLKEKAAAQRRLSAMVWLRRAGYLAAVVLVAWVILGSPVLALHADKVEVTGYGTVVEPEAVEAAVAPFEGVSLATLSTSALADALREIQGVKDAAIERVWPQGLLIELTSREPVAVVPDGEGAYRYVDAEATDVGRTEEVPAQLPVVSIPVGEDHVRALQSVLGVIAALPESLDGRVLDVSADTEDTVTFELREGPRVEWGSAEDSELKASVLEVLLASEQAKGATVVDVSAPTLPTIRRADG